MTARELLLRLSGHADERAAARVMASSLRRATDSLGIIKPLSLQELRNIARHQGVRELDFGVPLPYDGLLLAIDSGGFCLRVLQKSDTARARFTLAHELGHTFFYDRSTTPAVRLLPYDRRKPGSTEVEERFCDAFAAELLFPCGARKQVFSEYAPSDSLSLLKVVESVARAWAISVEAAFSCLDDSGLLRDRLVVMLRRSGHVKTRQDPALRILTTFPRPARHWFLPSNQRAYSVGFRGAVHLHKWWDSELRKQVEGKANRGVFSVSPDGAGFRILTNTDPQGECLERLWIGRKKSALSRWKRVKICVPVSYRMYVSNPKQAYCVAVLDLSRAEGLFG